MTCLVLLVEGLGRYVHVCTHKCKEPSTLIPQKPFVLSFERNSKLLIELEFTD